MVFGVSWCSVWVVGNAWEPPMNAAWFVFRGQSDVIESRKPLDAH